MKNTAKANQTSKGEQNKIKQNTAVLDFYFVVVLHLAAARDKQVIQKVENMVSKIHKIPNENKDLIIIIKKKQNNKVE